MTEFSPNPIFPQPQYDEDEAVAMYERIASSMRLVKDLLNSASTIVGLAGLLSSVMYVHQVDAQEPSQLSDINNLLSELPAQIVYPDLETMDVLTFVKNGGSGTICTRYTPCDSIEQALYRINETGGEWGSICC